MAERTRRIRLRYAHIDSEKSTTNRIVMRGRTKTEARYEIEFTVDQFTLGCLLEHACRLLGESIAAERRSHRSHRRRVRAAQAMVEDAFKEEPSNG